MKYLRNLLILASLVSGCGAGLPESRLDEPAFVLPAQEANPDDDAVILLHHEVEDQSYKPRETVKTVHRIVAILRDEALDDFGYFFIRVTDDEQLVDFEARVRAADGSEHSIDRSALVEQVVPKVIRYEDPDEETVPWEMTRLRGTVPGLSVGSVLELRYIVRSDTIGYEQIRTPQINLPIRHFIRDVRIPRQVRFDVEVMNSDVPFEISRTSSGTRIQKDDRFT